MAGTTNGLVHDKTLVLVDWTMSTAGKITDWNVHIFIVGFLRNSSNIINDSGRVAISIWSVW